jgi:H+/Cl- antiporter ClcA
MPDQSRENSISQDDPPVKNAVDTVAKGMRTPSGEPAQEVKTSFFLLMVYAAVFGTGGGLLAALFLVVYHWGTTFFAQPSHFGLGIGRFWPLVLLTVGGLLVGLAIRFTGEHGGPGVAQRQYAQTGQINPRYVPSIILEAIITLWSGAPVGPEAPLSFLSGGVGSFFADHLRIEQEDVPLLVYSSIAGCFGGFFGSPIVGAVGAYEYMFIHEINFYRHVIPGLLAASFGYGVYWVLLHTSFLGYYSFPSYASPRLIDLGWAILIGGISAIVGTLFKLVFGLVHLVFAPLKKRPVIRALAGGVIIGLIGSFFPLALYSGQEQLQEIIHNPAAYSALFLLLLVVVKALLTSTSFATGLEGGPIFPYLFIGGTLGLAISQIFPFIPQGVGVTTAMAGVTCAGFPIPLTVAMLLGIFGGQIDLLPTIVLGAVVGFLIAKALEPLLPKPKQAAQPSSDEATTA